MSEHAAGCWHRLCQHLLSPQALQAIGDVTSSLLTFTGVFAMCNRMYREQAVGMWY